jgi:hypothetical protein
MKWTIAYSPRITSAWDLINCKYLQRSVDLRFRSSSSETIVRQAVSWNSWLRHSESSQHLAAGRKNMETWKKCHTKCSQLWSGHESNAGFTVPQLLCRSCLRVFSPAQPQGTCGSDYVLACGGESPSTLDCRHRLWVFGIRWVYHGLPLLHAFYMLLPYIPTKGWTVPLGRRVRRTRSERNTLQVLRPIFSYLSDPRSSVRRQAELSAVAILQKAQEDAKHWRGCLIHSRWTCAESMPPILESMMRHHLTPEFFSKLRWTTWTTCTIFMRMESYLFSPSQAMVPVR